MPAIKLDKVVFHAKAVDAWQGEKVSDRDTGTLKVSKDQIEFVGEKYSLKIAHLANVIQQGKWEILFYEPRPGQEIPMGMRSKTVSFSRMTNGSAAISPQAIIEALKNYEEYREFQCWWMGDGGGDIRQPLREKGKVVFAEQKNLSIFHHSAPQMPILELDLADVRNINTNEVTKRDQILYVLNNSWKWGLGIAALMFVVTLLTAQKIVIPLGLLAFYAILIGIAGALIISIPNLLRARSAVEFALHKKDGSNIFFCVPPELNTEVKKAFEAAGKKIG